MKLNAPNNRRVHADCPSKEKLRSLDVKLLLVAIAKVWSVAVKPEEK